MVEVCWCGYCCLSLEIGMVVVFELVYWLYVVVGFVFCGFFSGYVDDLYSCFMMLVL